MKRTTSKQLIRLIESHVRKTGESGYAFCRRVLRDQTFLWKLKQGRTPYPSTVRRIRRAITRREQRLAAAR